MTDKSTYANAAAKINRGCVYEERSGIGVFRARSLISKKGVVHGFTARKGGVSPAPYDSLNMFAGKNDARDNVMENYRRLCAAYRLEFESLCSISFEHGNTVRKVTASQRGCGFYLPPLPACDGLITNDPSVTLITDHADCGCFFLYDPVKRAVGIAHAGWKGTLGRIGGATVELMRSEYGCEPQNIIASTGPCICQSCYEVGEDIAELFENEFKTGECSYPGKPGKAQLSLEKAAAIQLMEAGLPPENITLMEMCTYENEELLFSHRRDKSGTGDMAGFIKLA